MPQFKPSTNKQLLTSDSLRNQVNFFVALTGIFQLCRVFWAYEEAKKAHS